MTFHQKNSSYIARKIHDFRSLRYQSFFFFLPSNLQRFFQPTLRTSVSAFANGTHILRMTHQEMEEKKGCVSFQKVYYSFDTWPLCSTSRNANGKISYIDRCREKKKRKKRKKVDINEWPQVGFLTYAVRDPPETGFFYLLVRRGASLSSFRNSWANNSTENTHAGMCETR